MNMDEIWVRRNGVRVLFDSGTLVKGPRMLLEELDSRVVTSMYPGMRLVASAASLRRFLETGHSVSCASILYRPPVDQAEYQNPSRCWGSMTSCWSTSGEDMFGE